MKLESAIELRDELISQFKLEPKLTRSPSTGLGFRTRRQVAPPRIAIGISPTDVQEDDYLIAVRDQQQDASAREIIDQITSRCRGEVDYRQMSILSPRSANLGLIRPLVIGASISNENVTSGTIGLFVKRPNSSKRYLLSNSHVLVDDRSSSSLVIQPGSSEKVPGKNRVATLADWISVTVGSVNYIDAAIAEIDPSIKDNGNILASGQPIQGLAEVQGPGIHVSKNGRTTGLTHGLTRGFGLGNISVEWDNGVASFSDVFESYSANGNFSAGGDSGSLIYDKQNRGVGLLFAGGEELNTGLDITYAIPLTTVLKALNVVI
ncbi:hypothetical protein [Xanthomonas axonopodis]|uniref:hypothetical protein n=2 Tax=Xanthomonas TaxID=338 RepID=UPI00111677F6|nr:hypothetical protein [Xanthomonas axonopodis]